LWLKIFEQKMCQIEHQCFARSINFISFREMYVQCQCKLPLFSFLFIDLLRSYDVSVQNYQVKDTFYFCKCSHYN